MAMATPAFPPLPKSIVKHIAPHVKDFLTSTGVINYQREDFYAFKKKEELGNLKSNVRQALTNIFNAAYANSAMDIFSIKNVNKFIKEDHEKGRQTPESAAAAKEHNRLMNDSAKRRKQRKDEDALADAAKKRERATFLQTEAAKGEAILQRLIGWVHLLFQGELNVSEFPKVWGENALVVNKDVVLLNNDEKVLCLLKRDVDDILAILRGDASAESKRCCQIVVSLETLMEILRPCETVSHLFVNSSNAVTPSPASTSTTIPTKRHRGATPGASKWKFGDPVANKVGGKKVLSQSIRQKMNAIQRKVTSLHNDKFHRLTLEEDAITKKKLQRKSVLLSVEKAKFESECPTAMKELTSEELSDSIESKAKELCALLQEELQRKNNEAEGVALTTLPKGTSLLLSADPSALNNDSFLGQGVGYSKARLFSSLLASATHDDRQYSDDTSATRKKKKYNLPITIEASEGT